MIVPTFNERANVPRLVERLHAVLAGVHWQAIFVGYFRCQINPVIFVLHSLSLLALKKSSHFNRLSENPAGRLVEFFASIRNAYPMRKAQRLRAEIRNVDFSF